MDHTLLRAPLEAWSRHFRLRQKHVERQFAQIAEEASRGQTDGLLERLDALETYTTELTRQEASALDALSARFAWMQRGVARPPVELPTAIADYLLRHGHVAAGKAVRDDVCNEEQRRLLDYEQLVEMHGIVTAIQDRKSVAEGLEWVAANASKLRRMGSSLDFQLRLREFLHLAEQRQLPAALEYAAGHLAPAAKAAAAAAAAGPAAGGGDDGGAVVAANAIQQQQAAAIAHAATGSAGAGAGTAAAAPAAAAAAAAVMQQLQEAMSVLAFDTPATCGVPGIERLFSPVAWNQTAQLFRSEALAAAGMLPVPPLELILAAGAAALKTPSCRPCWTPTVKLPVPGGANGTAPPPAAATASDEDSMTGGATGSSSSSSSGGGATANAPASLECVLLPSVHTSNGCPLCFPHYFAPLVAPAPYLRQPVSVLYDAVTGEAIDADNPAYALPNGHVYAATTLAALTSEDGQRVACPRTGDVFPAADVRRAYVL